MGNSNAIWRQTGGWKQSYRDQLRREIEAVTPCEGVSCLNILLAGVIGSGKSSYFNSINGAMNDRVISVANTGFSGRSVTKRFQFYEVTPHLPFKICDTMGIGETSGEQILTSDVEIRNLMEAIKGHVPSGHIFQSGEEFKETNPAFISNPSIAMRAHCVAIVINANTFNNIPNTTLGLLHLLKDALSDEEVPTFVILTHIDEFDVNVGKDVTTMFRSGAVRDLVDSTSTKLRGIPENQIFPVVNYRKDVQGNLSIDIPLLLALRQMLYTAEKYAKKLSANSATCKTAVECCHKP